MNRALAPLSSSRRFLSVTWRCAATEQGAIPQGGQGVPSAASGSDTKELPQTRRKPHGSLEEALYLAKMAGIYTVDEVQYQIVKGPEFSRDDSPFMLENFLEVEPEEGDYDKLQEGEAGSESTGSNSDDGNKNNVNRMIHAAFERYGKPDMPAKFWHKDEEWLSRCEGRGTRKRAAAHALLVRGTGIFRVNGNEEGNCFRLLAEIERTYERISGFKVQVWC
ncbi:unnamed protein product [Durusdinium trenchii]|uniref:Uncharacterized protein n=2 Tax=Durusdinium trenchii TaxID=1381693 RepID=A0ABP0RVT9_9DINO